MNVNPIILNGKSYSFRFNDKDPLRSNGKFGHTFIGNSVDDNQQVIVKQLRSTLKNNSSAVGRFRRELEITLQHPRIAKVFDYIVQDGEHYIIREYIPGNNIGEYIKISGLKGKERIDFVLRAAIEILDALEALHSSSVFHCDIRPGNIIVSSGTNSVRLIDFGLARMKGTVETGRIPFSLIYSPPEQVLQFNELVDAGSDIYSLGVTMYELMTGKQAFHHSNPELLMNIMLSLPLEKNNKLPAEVYEILLKATAKHKLLLPPVRYNRTEMSGFLKQGQTQRFSSCQEFKRGILKFSNSHTDLPTFLERLFRKK